MPALKSMSVEELEKYRADLRAEMSVAKKEFRKAGKILDKKLAKADVDVLKAQRKALDAKIAEREGSDG